MTGDFVVEECAVERLFQSFDYVSAEAFRVPVFGDVAVYSVFDDVGLASFAE